MKKRLVITRDSAASSQPEKTSQPEKKPKHRHQRKKLKQNSLTCIVDTKSLRRSSSRGSKLNKRVHRRRRLAVGQPSENSLKEFKVLKMLAEM